jgi:Mn-dependent DtxR family transcriptional regulator
LLRKHFITENFLKKKSGDVNDDVEKVEDFEKFVNQFNKRLRVDDV